MKEIFCFFSSADSSEISDYKILNHYTYEGKEKYKKKQEGTSPHAYMT